MERQHVPTGVRRPNSARSKAPCVRSPGGSNDILDKKPILLFVRMKNNEGCYVYGQVTNRKDNHCPANTNHKDNPTWRLRLNLWTTTCRLNAARISHKFLTSRTQPTESERQVPLAKKHVLHISLNALVSLRLVVRWTSPSTVFCYETRSCSPTAS